MALEVQLALIGQIAAIIAAIGVVVVGVTTVILSKKIKAIDVNIDGRLSQLLDVSRQLARAEGIVEGTTVERSRIRDVRTERASDRVEDVAASNLAADTEAARQAPSDQGRIILP